MTMIVITVLVMALSILLNISLAAISKTLSEKLKMEREINLQSTRVLRNIKNILRGSKYE